MDSLTVFPSYQFSGGVIIVPTQCRGDNERLCEVKPHL